MLLLHITTKENLNSILKEGLLKRPKRVTWEDKEGSVTSDRTLPKSECPAAIYAYPLSEDKKARYNCWVLGSEDEIGEADSIGIIFEPSESTWVNIGTWAFGADFVTRKRPIRWCYFKDEVNALTANSWSTWGC